MEHGAEHYFHFLEGNKESFVKIVEEYRDGLTMFVNSLVNNIHLAEEIADETFLKLYVKKPHYKAEYSFKTWLYTIGKNMAKNYMKKQKRQAYEPIEDYYYISDETDIEADYIKGERNVDLHNAIKRLKPEYSQVLYLVYFEQMSNSEVARIMKKSNKQLAELIYRAKKALKRELESEEL